MAFVTFKAQNSATTYTIEPAPLVTYSKSYETTEDGSELDSSIQVTLKGTLVPNMGNPTSTGWAINADIPSAEGFTTDDDKFQSLTAKMGLLEDIFRSRYVGDSVQEDASSMSFLQWGIGGGKTMGAYVALESLDFVEDQWVERADYTATFRTGELIKGGFASGMITGDSHGEYNSHNLISASEEVDLEEMADGSGDYQLTRTISATARYNPSANGDREPWERAKDWCLDRIGDEDAYALDLGEITLGGSFASSLAGYTAGSRKRSERIGRMSGTYTITETWVLSSSTDDASVNWTVTEELIGPTREISAGRQLGSTGVGGVKTRITVAGTVTGRQSGAAASTAHDNAVSYFKDNVYNEDSTDDPWENVKAQVNGMRNLSDDYMVVDRQTITNNKSAGTISFSFSFAIPSTTVDSIYFSSTGS
jgi:hypothetical protein